ncbi:hypothetical protein [Aliiroseovarius crassostreae]|nr:hypothetical protein [Aliiroseovarius crassostreae]
MSDAAGAKAMSFCDDDKAPIGQTLKVPANGIPADIQRLSGFPVA